MFQVRKFGTQVYVRNLVRDGIHSEEFKAEMDGRTDAYVTSSSVTE
jgi:hypothetical protein